MYGSYSRGLYHAVPLWLLWTFHAFLVLGNIILLMLIMLEETGDGQSASGIHIFLMILELLSFVSEPIEMVLWSHHLLEPWLYLLLQIFKALFWTTMTPVSISQMRDKYYVDEPWYQPTLTTLFVCTPITFYLGLGYAVFVFRRSRKRGSRFVYRAAEDREKMVER